MEFVICRLVPPATNTHQHYLFGSRSDFGIHTVIDFVICRLRFPSEKYAPTWWFLESDKHDFAMCHLGSYAPTIRWSDVGMHELIDFAICRLRILSDKYAPTLFSNLGKRYVFEYDIAMCRPGSYAPTILWSDIGMHGFIDFVICRMGIPTWFKRTEHAA